MFWMVQRISKPSLAFLFSLASSQKMIILIQIFKCFFDTLTARANCTIICTKIKVWISLKIAISVNLKQNCLKVHFSKNFKDQFWSDWETNFFSNVDKRTGYKIIGLLTICLLRCFDVLGIPNITLSVVL